MNRILLVLLFTLTFIRSCDHRDCKKFELLVHAKDQFNFTSNNAESVLDPNHRIMINALNGTIYTQEDADDITYNSLSYFWCQFGLNFFSALPNAVGIRTIPGVGFYLPYQSGINELYRWIYGSNNPEVFEDQDWWILDVGALVVFTNNGTFPGGIMAGTTYKNQSLIAYTQYTYLKTLEDNEDRTLDDIRIIRTVSREISYSVPNELGISQQLIFVQAIDEQDRPGYAAITVSVQQRPERVGILVQRNRAVLTFNYTQKDHLPCRVPWVGEKWTGLQE
ncbi:Hypothetical protein POVR1_LOCUS513 [uncultured virus]|nr:Hypothetical protein POVR1_LOCUS513 [uncultured virus]